MTPNDRLDRQAKAVTEHYLNSERSEFEVPLNCSCPQRPYPHELSIHSRVRDEYGNPKLRNRWPWSLCLSPREEPSTERNFA